MAWSGGAAAAALGAWRLAVENWRKGRGCLYRARGRRDRLGEFGTAPRIRIGQRNGRGEDAGGEPDSGAREARREVGGGSDERDPPVGETERGAGEGVLTSGVHRSATEKGERGCLAGPTGQRERRRPARLMAPTARPHRSAARARGRPRGKASWAEWLDGGPRGFSNLFLLIKSRNSNKFK